MPERDMLEHICETTGADPETVRAIATAVLRELHYVAANDEMVTTGTLMQTKWQFGTEAAYHLGGVLKYHDDCTNRPGAQSDSLIPETMRRLMGSQQHEADELRGKWLALLASRHCEAKE